MKGQEKACLCFGKASPIFLILPLKKKNNSIYDEQQKNIHHSFHI